MKQYIIWYTVYHIYSVALIQERMARQRQAKNVTCSSTAQGSSPAQHFNKTLLFQSQQLPGQTLKKNNCIQSAQGKRPSVIFMLKHLLRASKHAHHNMFTTNLHSPSVSLGGRGKGLERQLER